MSSSVAASTSQCVYEANGQAYVASDLTKFFSQYSITNTGTYSNVSAADRVSLSTVNERQGSYTRNVTVCWIVVRRHWFADA